MMQLLLDGARGKDASRDLDRLHLCQSIRLSCPLLPITHADLFVPSELASTQVLNDPTRSQDERTGQPQGITN